MMRAAFALLAVLGAGCTMTVEHLGLPALLEDLPQPVGVARAEAIVSEFGVPDEIEPTGQGFRFVYHFVQRNESLFQVGTYGLKLVTNERVQHREGSLDLSFDAAGRLLASTLRDDVQKPGHSATSLK